VTVSIRDDLAEAHREAWEHIARPGSWWTGAQRVELASTAASAITDRDPLSPWVRWSLTDRSVAGCAPGAAHDAAYRIARHAGTVTETFYRSTADEIGELPYVELCAIVSTVAAVVHFCRAIGIDVPPFPDPERGDPTGECPDAVVQPRLNWVQVAAPADEVAAVVQAYSAVPGEMVNTWRMAAAQYMPEDEMIHADWMRRPGGLTRPQTELIAARIAQLRECFY
jgi:hypothetical protein